MAVNQMNDNDNGDLYWKTLYRIGAAAALLAVLAGIAEMLITMLPDGGISSSVLSVKDWIAVYQRNPWMGMRNLGLINILLNTLSVFIFFALFGAHRKANHAMAGLALVLSMIGLAVFFADNRAFSMLELSRQYSATSTDAQRSALEAAGQAMLSVGRSHSAGTFLGFALCETAGIIMSLAMFSGKVFGKATAVSGIVGYICLLFFEVITSFMTGLTAVTTMVAMLGGFAMMAWYILSALRLFKLAGK
jgi:hypothetical protein